MPLLQRQSYRGLTSSTSKAAWHSLLLSSMASFSLPTRHWRITRYRELQWGFWLHMSLAWMQSTHSVWALGPDPAPGGAGALVAKDVDKAEGPSQELAASSKWGQESRGSGDYRQEAVYECVQMCFRECESTDIVYLSDVLFFAGTRFGGPTCPYMPNHASAFLMLHISIFSLCPRSCFICIYPIITGILPALTCTHHSASKWPTCT